MVILSSAMLSVQPGTSVSALVPRKIPFTQELKTRDHRIVLTKHDFIIRKTLIDTYTSGFFSPTISSLRNGAGYCQQGAEIP
jgi:hypothetical protein